MIIGLDFDNTIVCYDELFPRAAIEHGLVPADIPRSKSHIRDYLRREGREDDWTRLQGYVYGERMAAAAMFPGVLDFLSACRGLGATVFIISHKTRSPYLGPYYDLHQTARDWILNSGLYDPGRTTLTPDHVFFELTKQAKLDRIHDSGCSVFIDDLPEFLAEPGFPEYVERILFDPQNLYRDETRYFRALTWMELTNWLHGRARDAG